MKLKQIFWALSPFAAGALLWLTLGAAADLENVYFPSVRVAHTNYVDELVVTNGATIGGVRQTAWPSGGSVPSGTLTTNGAAISAGDLVAYGTSKTNTAKATSANVQAALGSPYQATNAILTMISTNSTSKQAATNMLAATGSSADVLLGNGNWGVVSFANTTNSLAAPGNTNSYLNGKGLWSVPLGGTGSGSTNWVDSGTTNANLAGTASMYNLVVSNQFTTPTLIAGTLSLSNIVASTVPVFDGSSPPVLVPSQTTTNELDYLHGVTSALQSQINGKQPTNSTLTAASTNSFFGTGRIPLESELTNSTAVTWNTNTLILTFGAGLTWNTNTLILAF